MLVSVTMVAGLACTVPAQAAPAVPAAPPSAVANSVIRHAATGMKETESTASNGDFTLDVDLGESLDPATTQQLISQIQNENPRLSDTIKRMFEQGMVQLPADTADASWDPATGWQDFDGTLTCRRRPPGGRRLSPPPWAWSPSWP
jgi:hypothetical protein